MTFAGLSTGALVGAAVATTVAVVVLYLLRRTPRQQTVSNVAFWRRAAERSRPRSLFATRVPWIAMLLSLAVALLIVGEMGDPRTGTGFSGTTVIVMDADRTMGTRDVHGRRRLDEALSLARDSAQADTVSGQIAIVRAGVRTEVLVPLTHRMADAERAFARIETDDGTADLAQAVAVARSIVHQARGAGRVLVLTDREDFPRMADAAVPLVLVPVGAPGETIAITALDARRDPSALGEYWVRCEVRSYASRAARVHLVIRDRDVALSDEQLTLEAGETRVHRAHGFSSVQGELTARLEDVVIHGAPDALAADDVAYATVPPVVATRVLLVTRGNRFLANALAANPSVELETVAPGALDARRATLGRDHVVVLDRVVPQPPLDHPAQMFVGVTDPRVMRVGDEVSSPRVTAVATDHRVLAGVRFDQVQITRARALIPDGDDRVLLRSGRNALMVARERNGARTLALGFDTEGTDLVQRIAFPLFMHNALVWLDRREREFHSWQAPGEPIRASGSVVLMPTGEGREVHGALFDTTHAGIYHSAERATAVSAADQAGSLAVLASSGGTLRTLQPSRRPSLTVLLAAAMLVLLSVEWWFTQRGRLQ